MPKLLVNDLDLKGKRVLVRVDFNVPLKEQDGKQVVTDDTRVRAALPTIETIVKAGGKAILMSHLGRPKNGPEARFSLAPVATYMAGVVTYPVNFVDETTGPKVKAAIDAMPEGSVLILENTRFLAGETKNDETISRQLSELADVYVNDAFGSAHRAHASTEGVTRFVSQSAMGYLLGKEVDYLTRVVEQPEKPFIAVLGGAKVSDKILLIENLLPKVDHILIGGAMSYTFLKALGIGVGSSRVEDDKLDVAKELYEKAAGKIMLPTDHVVAAEFSNDAEHRTVLGDIPEGLMGLDIGPATVESYRETLLGARTIVWNGPMGVFEMSNYSRGTFAIAETLAEATTTKGAMTVVGGGDSVAAINQSGYNDKVSHVSTGGGAMLEFLEGKVLPGVAAISER